MDSIARTCPVCQTLLGPEQELRICDECGTTFHLECWNSLGGCGMQGCRNAAAFEKQPPPEESYWGATTKLCPMCRETIKATDTVCPHCQTRFDTAEPMTAEDVLARARPKQHSAAGTGPAVAIFVFGLLGCPAPLNLLIGGVWFMKRRAWLREVAPTRHILAVVGLAASALYTLVMLGALVCRPGGG